MRGAWPAWAVVTIALAVAGLPALAHTVPMTGQEMVRASRFIVVARVERATPVWNERHNLVLTRYTLVVEDPLRGAPPQELEVTEVGGTLDGETQRSCMTVGLEIGRRYVLFVNDPAVPSFSAFTGSQSGVFLEVPSESETGGEPTIATAGGAFVELTGGQRIAFREFVQRLRRFVAATEAAPAPPARAPAVHDPPLPSKVFEPVTPMEVLAPVVPIDRGAMPAVATPAAGPEPPAHPQLRVYGEEAGRLVPPRPDSTDYSYARAPARYIVWNELHPSFAPWSPHDQMMMSRWNSYGDIHRVSGAPTGNWAWGNNRYDMTGWPSSQDMMNQFGQGWGANELAICWTRWFGSGPIIEADISMNPAFAWTLDNEVGTHSDGAWGYDQSVLHELGHSWGLAHPWEVQDVWWDSVMNYSPKPMRYPNLYADDTNAIRAAYPGIGIHDGLLSMYQTTDAMSNNNASYLETYPNVNSVQQMDYFRFNQNFKMENIGTDNIVDPQIEVYLTPQRMNWSGYVYLQTLYYGFTMGTYATWTLDAGWIYVPYNTPPGDYWVALWLRDAADPYTHNNEAWGSKEYGTLRVTSYPWMIYPLGWWQAQAPTLGPNGQYDFYFYAYPGQRFDFSTCPEDGGSGSFDTVIEVFDPFGSQIGYADDNCGVQSRISLETATEGSYRVSVRGYFPSSYGPFSLVYRQRGFEESALLVTGIWTDPGADAVVLSWGGDAGPYDLERATLPDFSDAVRLLNGAWDTSYADPVLSDGVSYFYRVR
jgi:hypothetical protein